MPLLSCDQCQHLLDANPSLGSQLGGNLTCRHNAHLRKRQHPPSSSPCQTESHARYRVRHEDSDIPPPFVLDEGIQGAEYSPEIPDLPAPQTSSGPAGPPSDGSQSSSTGTQFALTSIGEDSLVTTESEQQSADPAEATKTSRPGGQESQSQTESNADGITYPFPHAGSPLAQHPTVFEVEKEAREQLGLPPHAPFAGPDEWEVAEFIVESDMSQRDTDRFLRTRMVSYELYQGLETIFKLYLALHSTPIAVPLLQTVTRRSPTTRASYVLWIPSLVPAQSGSTSRLR